MRVRISRLARISTICAASTLAAPQAAPAQTVTPPPVYAVQVERARGKTDLPRLLAQAQPATVDRTVSAAPAPTAFEVSSVRPRKSGTPMHIYECSGDRFMSAGPGLGDLLKWAYDADREFSNRVPLPLRYEYYDIEAKATGPIESEPQCQLLARAVLEDRFKLRWHWEEREGEVFDLVVARGGPKMQTALPTDEGTDASIVVDGKMAGGIIWGLTTDPEMRGRKGMTMQQLARYLPESAPVTDKTGLEGRYKIDLRYSGALSANVGDSPMDPPLDAALAKLGLRLEKRKGIVKVPVLDHIEPPDAN